mmetsp:Transcript_3877/g.8206  ORF Transcript_3877/g.8206 Transcript_3877/m.8206 type:complete len:87 (-) Transcript_3877:50-310(-)
MPFDIMFFRCCGDHLWDVVFHQLILLHHGIAISKGRRLPPGAFGTPKEKKSLSLLEKLNNISLSKRVHPKIKLMKQEIIILSLHFL